MVSSLWFPDQFSAMSGADVLLYCSDSHRSLMVDGLRFSPLVDVAADELTNQGYKCQGISGRFSRLPEDQVYASAPKFNRSFFVEELRNRTIRKLTNAGPSSDVLARILGATGAQVLVSVGATAAHSKTARMMGVSHFEIMHGLGYGKVGYGWDELAPEYLPQTLLTFDDESYETHGPLRKRGMNIEIVEHPLFGEEVSTLWRSQDEISGLSKMLSVDKYNKTVLVSLQWGYAGELAEFDGILENGIIPTAIVDLFKQTPDVLWILRAHPVHFNNRRFTNIIGRLASYESQFANVAFGCVQGARLSSVLELADGQITMSSATCYEAAAIGKKTLALCPSLVSPVDGRPARFVRLHKDKMVDYGNVHDVEGIKSWVISVKAKAPRRLSGNLVTSGSISSVISQCLMQQGS